MIAIDTSSWIAYLGGEAGFDVEATDRALRDQQAVLPPIVLTELLSDPALPAAARGLIMRIPVLDLVEAYWARSGRLRSKLIARGRRARLADSLIAQSCLDHGVGLVSRNGDFRHFVPHGLKLFYVVNRHRRDAAGCRGAASRPASIRDV